MHTHWYENFFHGITMELWETACSEEQTRTEADLIERLLQPEPGARLLDVPCGTGRHVAELAGRGYRITGVDVSETCVEKTRTHAAANRERVEVVQSDMRDLGWKLEFDGVYCLGNSFGYLDRDGTEAFFASVARTLKTGARLLLESGLVAEAILPNLEQRDWYQVGDVLMLSEHKYQVDRSCIETRYRFLKGGREEEKTAFYFVYTVSEIKRMLEDVGLQVQGLFKSEELSVFELGADRLILLAEKSA